MTEGRFNVLTRRGFSHPILFNKKGRCIVDTNGVTVIRYAMRVEWEECPRDDLKPQYAGIYVTMNPKGEIAMTRSTYQIMGEPKALLLLFDRNNRRIGLKPASPAMRNAYPIKDSGRCGGKKVHAFRLIRQYNIDLPVTVTFPEAEIDDDGIMRLDLHTAKVPLRVKNHWKKQEKKVQ